MEFVSNFVTSIWNYIPLILCGMYMIIGIITFIFMHLEDEGNDFKVKDILPALFLGSSIGGFLLLIFLLDIAYQTVIRLISETSESFKKTWNTTLIVSKKRPTPKWPNPPPHQNKKCQELR